MQQRLYLSVESLLLKKGRFIQNGITVPSPPLISMYMHRRICRFIFYYKKVAIKSIDIFQNSILFIFVY
jgi:hypothetical protein